MSANHPPSAPSLGLNALNSIFDSANDLLAVLSPSPSQAPSPLAQSPGGTQLPKLVLYDHKRARDKFKRFHLSSTELSAVLRVYREQLAVIRKGIRDEYRILCETLPSYTNPQVVTTLGEYWIRTRDALLQRAVELTADALQMLNDPQVFQPNKSTKFILIYPPSLFPAYAQVPFQQGEPTFICICLARH